MTIASKLLLLASSKAAIRSAIEAQGVPVPAGAPFSDYARLVGLVGTVAPLFTAQPAITGTPAVGRRMTASEGVASGTPAPTLTLQWLRDGQPIASATGLTYDVADADLGAKLTVRVTATNRRGTVTVTPDPVGPVIVIQEPIWTREQAVTLQNSGGPAASGYQALIVLDASNFDFAGSRADGADLRLLDTDKATQLPFWIERFDRAGKGARIWVKADLPAGGAKTVYLYSGNDEAAPRSNGDAVFPFFDDFAGLPGWNRYKVTNPVIQTAADTWKRSIVGDPMVIGPDALTNEWGAFYFGSASTTCDIGYMRSMDGGQTWVDGPSNPVFTHTQAGFARVLKPSVIYWPPATCYYMAYTAENDGQNRQIRLAKATSRMGPWADIKMLLTGDGGPVEGAFVDCANFCFDGTKLRLYYSANESQNLEPRNFCVALFADGPESALTRWSGNPIAAPKPDVSWANKGLGGMSVRKLADGSFDFAFNAFTDGEVSRMGRANSPDGYSLTIREGDLLMPLGPAGAWDRVRHYRPCIYNTGTGPDRVLFNALGDTEQIGYAELGRVFDPAKWTPNLQGDPRLDQTGGVLRMGETRTQNPGSYFTMVTPYRPGVDVVIETRMRLDAVFDTQFADLAPILFGSGLPFPNAAYDNHFLFYSAFNGQVRHQNRSGGNWGDEDTVVAGAPPVGEFRRYRTVKRAATMDWEVLSDAGASLGKLAGNTDAPQGFDLPLSIGMHGMEASFDFVLARQHLATPPTVSVGAAQATSRAGL